MTNYLNPSTRSGGAEQIIVPERTGTAAVDEAPFDDVQYARVNGEWLAVDLSSLRVSQFSSDGSTFTSTSVTGESMGTSGAEGTFVAPASGDVLIWVSGQAKASVAGQAAAIAYEVRAGATIGSGSIISSRTTDRSFLTTNTQYVRGSMPFLLEGLVPGDTYNVRTFAMSGDAGSTASLGHCRITVAPQP
jgi:hypothetical protein